MAIEARCLKCKAGFQIGLKVCPKCGVSLKENKRYRVRVKLPDGKWFSKTCKTLTQARSIEAKVKADTLDGQFFKYKKAGTLGAVWEKYLPWAKGNKASWTDDEERYRNYLEPRFGRVALHKLSVLDVDRYFSDLRNATNKAGRPMSPQLRKHIFVLLRRIINWAKDRDLYAGPNPCDKVKLPAFDNSVTNPLPQDAQERLAAALEDENPRAALVIKFGLATGRRAGEILALKWSDVDFSRGLVVFQGMNTKNRKTQTLPVSPWALEVLREAEKRRVSDYVFPSRTGEYFHSFSNRWRRIREKAGLGRKYRFHDLRHTFATVILAKGADLYRVQRLLGHKTASMTQRYAHLSDESLRAAAGAVADPAQAAQAELIRGLADVRPNAFRGRFPGEDEAGEATAHDGPEPEGLGA